MRDAVPFFAPSNGVRSVAKIARLELVDAVRADWRKLSVEALDGVRDEPAHVVRRADGPADGIDFAAHGVGVDLRLGVVPAAAPLALGGLIHLLVQLVDARMLQGEPELLAVCAVVQQDPVDHRLDNLLRFDRHGHGDAESLPDGAGLPDQDAEHDQVDLVVGAVEQTGANGLLCLAVAIDPALALLQPVGVPGQVVVKDGIEPFLEVDAVAQAIGGDEDADGLPGSSWTISSRCTQPPSSPMTERTWSPVCFFASCPRRC